jgi:hypothetical protein
VRRIIQTKQFTGKVERLDLTKFVNTEDLDEDDKMLIQHVRKLLPAEVSRYLNRNSPFSGIWENIIQQHNDELPEETRHLIIEYLLPKYKKLFSELSESEFVYTLGYRKALCYGKPAAGRFFKSLYTTSIRCFLQRKCVRGKMFSRSSSMQ